MLLAVPLFDQSSKWCLDLPNAANVSFHFPTVLRIYMLGFIPGTAPLFCVPDIWIQLKLFKATNVEISRFCFNMLSIMLQKGTGEI